MPNQIFALPERIAYSMGFTNPESSRTREKEKSLKAGSP
jgi:hypothetical protein